jgi:uncharacterized membrane protein YfcA
VRVLLASPLGFLIGVTLGAVGGGGSILAVPILVYAAGLPPKRATTASLVIVGITAVAGLPAQLRAHRVRVVAGLLFSGFGLAGSFAGTRVNQGIDPDVLLLAFSGLMGAAAVAMTLRRREAERTVELLGESGDTLATQVRHVDTATALKVVAAGTVVGFLTGLFGVGGGFVIVPALVLVLGYGMPVAAGTSLLVIVLNSAVALAQRAGGNPVPWDAVVEFGIAAVPGVLVGTWLSRRVAATTLSRWFVVLLVAVASYTAVRSGIAVATG